MERFYFLDAAREGMISHGQHVIIKRKESVTAISEIVHWALHQKNLFQIFEFKIYKYLERSIQKMFAISAIPTIRE